MAGKQIKAQPDIRQLWGIAKSPELRLTDEELHVLVEGHTGKSSIRALNKREMQAVIRVLVGMKESTRKPGRTQDSRRGKGGSPATENQRKKIYKLTQELGWDKPSRLSGMCRKMFGVTSVEWLDYTQSSKLIEALKAMAGRQEKKEEGSQHE